MLAERLKPLGGRLFDLYYPAFQEIAFFAGQAHVNHVAGYCKLNEQHASLGLRIVCVEPGVSD